MLISQTPAVKHQREYWPKPSRNNDIYTYTAKDSIIQVQISEDGDTMILQKEYLRRGRSADIYLFRDESYGYYPSIELTHFNWNNRFFTNGRTIKTYERSLKADTTIFWGNPWRIVYRKIDFNLAENEHYTMNRKLVYRRKIVEYNTFYHDYFKQYFTTKTVSYYKKGKGFSKIIRYDAYGTIEEKTVFYDQ